MLNDVLNDVKNGDFVSFKNRTMNIINNRLNNEPEVIKLRKEINKNLSIKKHYEKINNVIKNFKN